MALATTAVTTRPRRMEHLAEAEEDHPVVEEAVAEADVVVDQTASA